MSIRKEGHTILIKQALLELRRTGLFTGLTLIMCLGLYFYIPDIKSQFQEKQTKIREYQRIYRYTNQGANLRYRKIRDTAESQERLNLDLAILMQRFQSNDFTILSLPGLKTTEEYHKIFKHRSSYTYNLRKEKNVSILEIRAANSQAVKALHVYMGYIEKNWH